MNKILVHSILTILLFGTNIFAQDSIIHISNWKDLNFDGYYKLAQGSADYYRQGYYRDKHFNGQWIELWNDDSTIYTFTVTGILIDRKKYFRGMLSVHDQIRFDTLENPILITKQYLTKSQSEIITYKNKLISTNYFNLVDSLCDYTEFDYLSIGDGGDMSWCPRNQFRSKYENVETEGNRHLIFRYESIWNPSEYFIKQEVYYYDGTTEILLAEFNNNVLVIHRKQKEANEIILSFPFLYELAQMRGGKDKNKYNVLIHYFKRN